MDTTAAGSARRALGTGGSWARRYLRVITRQGDPWAAVAASLASLGLLAFVAPAWPSPARAAIVIAASAAALGLPEAAEAARAALAALRWAAALVLPGWRVLRPGGPKVLPRRVGDVVWAWLPYEGRGADGSWGKDRPVAVLGRDGRRFYGLALTSKDHTARGDVAIGAGDWDSNGRRSFVKVGKVVELPAADIRRLGGSGLDARQLDMVLAAGHARHGRAAFGKAFTLSQLPVRAMSRSGNPFVLAAGYLVLGMLLARVLTGTPLLG